MSETKKSTSKKTILIFLLYFFLLAIFIEIPFISRQPTFGHIYSYFQTAITIFILINFIVKKRYSRFWVYLVVFLTITVLSSLINSANTLHSVQEASRILGLCMIADFGIRGSHQRLFFTASQTILGLYIFANIISIFIAPTGLYTDILGYRQNWLLGFKNSHVKYYLLYLLVSFLRQTPRRKFASLSSVSTIVIFFAFSIIVGSSTSAVCLSVIFILTCLKKILLKHPKILSPLHIVLGYLILFFSVVFFHVQEFFSGLIEFVLHRNATFTGRTSIWDASIQQISQKPLLGYGESSNTYEFTSYRLAASSHNFVLDTIHTCGLIGLAAFAALAYAGLKPLTATKFNPSSYSLLTIVVGFLVVSIVEAPGLALPCLLLTFCYDVQNLTPKYVK